MKLQFTIFLVLIASFLNYSFSKSESQKGSDKMIKLSNPKHDGKVSVEKALLNRRSIRSYKDDSLTMPELSQLLWAAQGITNKERSLRAAPSAGATYPLEIYVVAGDVKGLEKGVYKYVVDSHSIKQVSKGDKRRLLFEAGLKQSSLLTAPITIIVSAIYFRTEGKYRDRAKQYVHMEVGGVAQNVYLQAESLGLGTVFMGAFSDNQISKAIGLSSNEIPLCLLPVGKKQ
jgi:SagB-type dehydrogenase family enzyme